MFQDEVITMLERALADVCEGLTAAELEDLLALPEERGQQILSLIQPELGRRELDRQERGIRLGESWPTGKRNRIGRLRALIWTYNIVRVSKKRFMVIRYLGRASKDFNMADVLYFERIGAAVTRDEALALCRQLREGQVTPDDLLRQEGATSDE